MTKTLQEVLRLIVVICFPVLFLTTSVRLAFNEIRLYEYGFEKYQVSLLQRTDRAGLTEIARELITYFNSAVESPGEQLCQVFSTPEEIEHLREVKVLVRRCHRVQEISLGVVLASLIAGFIWWRGAFLPRLARWVVAGSGLTILSLFLLGITGFLAFDWLWWQLHLVVFPGSGYWILDPAKHNMIRMFPTGFWFDAGRFVAWGTGIAALIMGGLAGGYLIVRRRSTAK